MFQISKLTFPKNAIIYNSLLIIYKSEFFFSPIFAIEYILKHNSDVAYAK